jgi:hypothetical protein
MKYWANEEIKAVVPSKPHLMILSPYKCQFSMKSMLLTFNFDLIMDYHMRVCRSFDCHNMRRIFEKPNEFDKLSNWNDLKTQRKSKKCSGMKKIQNWKLKRKETVTALCNEFCEWLLCVVTTSQFVWNLSAPQIEMHSDPCSQSFNDLPSHNWLVHSMSYHELSLTSQPVHVQTCTFR